MIRTKIISICVCFFVLFFHAGIAFASHGDTMHSIEFTDSGDTMHSIEFADPGDTMHSIEFTDPGDTMHSIESTDLDDTMNSVEFTDADDNIHIRFQSKTVPNECIGGSGSDSKVGLWSCAADTERYNWELVESNNPEIFYIRNIAKQSRCLMSKSNNYDLRYYSGGEDENNKPQCRWISYSQWRIKKADGTYYSKNDINTSLDGKNIELVNEHNGKCITEINGQIRLKPCDGSNSQEFEVNQPEDIVCSEVVAGSYTYYYGHASCTAAYNTFLSRYISSNLSRSVLLDRYIYRPELRRSVRVSCIAQLPFSGEAPIIRRSCN